jgi:Transposase DDE domain group 1
MPTATRDPGSPPLRAYWHGTSRRDSAANTSRSFGANRGLRFLSPTGYSFILTDLHVSTGEQATSVEHWYRHRTEIEDRFRDSKHGAALRHLPSGYAEINTAWMWGALLATSIAGWLHQLTATADQHGRLHGHGTRGGKAMIATLRHLIIRVPGRLTSHAGRPVLRLPPGHQLLAEILARLRDLPTPA